MFTMGSPSTRSLLPDFTSPAAWGVSRCCLGLLSSRDAQQEERPDPAGCGRALWEGEGCVFIPAWPSSPAVLSCFLQAVGGPARTATSPVALCLLPLLRVEPWRGRIAAQAHGSGWEHLLKPKNKQNW